VGAVVAAGILGPSTIFSVMLCFFRPTLRALLMKCGFRRTADCVAPQFAQTSHLEDLARTYFANHERHRPRLVNTSPALTRADVTIQRSKPLGRGGYGVVYRGELRGNAVAVKAFFAAAVENPGSVLVPPHVSRKLLQDVAIMCTLNHHNVVQVFGAVSECGWLVMELCTGGSLKSLLVDSGQALDRRTPMRFAAETCIGVAYLHHSHVVHGDLKADNLMLSDPEPSRARIKLTDFGMAEAKDYSVSISRLDVSTAAAGTVRFTAPELLLNQATSKTFKSDVYAMSITMWEIFERGTPYGVMPDAAVIAGVKTGMRPELRATPFNVVSVLKGCWAQEIQQRWSAECAAMELIKLAGLSLDTAVEPSHGQYAPSSPPFPSGEQPQTRRGEPNDARDECCICMASPKDTALVPCGHGAFCGECASRLSVCPECRREVTSVLKVYM
jgi:Protein tyrosine and serine/threonine kinase/Zinc finger, C3HC4 type (RING finger)